MNDHEARLQALEKARKELEDAFIVMTHLETKQSAVIRQLAESSEEQRKQLEEQRKHAEEQRKHAEKQRKLNEQTDQRIADLVSAIGRLIANRPPNEARPL